MQRLVLSCGVAAALFTVAAAQDSLAGTGKFPQARTVSGLSGGGLPVRSDGLVRLDGALSMSTPIGNTLGGGQVVLMGSNTSDSRSPRWFDGKTRVNRANGTAALMAGAPFAGGRLALTVMQTSRLAEDRIVNLQYSPPRQKGRLGVAVGVQDVFDETVTTPDYGDTTRSMFAVGTYEVGAGVYLTAGVGTARFSKGFAGASFRMGKEARGVIEHDGFGWNFGSSFGTGRLLGVGKHEDAVLFVGLCQSRYFTWSLSFRG